MIEKEDKLHGIRLREKELEKLYVKHRKLQQRYDAFYTAYGLMGDALEKGKAYPLTEIEKFIKANMKDLADQDLAELRQVFDFIQEDNPDIAIREVLGAKKITLKEEIIQ